MPIVPLGRAQYVMPTTPPPVYARPDTSRAPFRGRPVEQEKPKVEEKPSNVIVKSGTTGKGADRQMLF